jgi:hypothetical protein
MVSTALNFLKYQVFPGNVNYHKFYKTIIDEFIPEFHNIIQW